MSFCPNCGVPSDQNHEICGHCGANLLMANRRQNSSPPPTNNFNGARNGNKFTGQQFRELEDAPTGDLQSRSNDPGEPEQFIRADSQLGKGTIIPQAVQRDIDGFHFKYDEPPRPLSKAEPAKDKTVEFHAVGEDVISPVEAISGQVGATVVNGTAPETGPDKEGPATVLEPQTVCEDSGPVAAAAPKMDSGLPTETLGGQDELGEQNPVPEALPFAEEEVAPAIRATENDIPESPVVLRIIWEGTGCLMGIPFGPHYQITNQYIRIRGRNHERVQEYSLGKIAMLKVKQNWFGRLWGFGDLVATLREQGAETDLTLKAIPNPAGVLRIIADLIGSEYNIKYG